MTICATLWVSHGRTQSSIEGELQREISNVIAAPVGGLSIKWNEMLISYLSSAVSVYNINLDFYL